MSNVATARKTKVQLDIDDPGKFYANRVRVYPKAVHGPVRTVKYLILVACLAVYYILPWLRWDRGPNHPSQMVLLDLPNRRFYFAWIELWPQDIYLLAGALIMGAVGLFLITSLVGRVWCGYTCPQTVWTDLFMWVERRIEGDRNERMRRDQGPWTLDKVWRKLAKHAVWLVVAFWTGGAWIMYYVDAPTAVRQFWTGQASLAVYFFIGLFTLTTYLLAGWAREQVCTYMCPWPRFQSAMLDEESLTVTYEAWRGEPRGHGKRDAAHRNAQGQVLGDCVDCNACVHACPTGIDIRDGIQLECINCGLCVDACNEIMHKVGGKPDLITWDTLGRLNARREGRPVPDLKVIRPRTMIYLGVMLVATLVVAAAFFTRSQQILFVGHDRAPLFVLQPDGAARNAYSVSISNKTLQDQTYTIRVDGVPGARMRLADRQDPPADQLTLTIPPDSVGMFRILVAGRLPRGGDTAPRLDFTLTNTATGATSVYQSVFMGPPT
ncbi:cytochrome c oxidase accessory protein CcoG [Rhodopila sp.]|jgi:cytochrome c oxidase accessory protein FixG|uniref:cytochrome c oxidase accessory protein CcoG n=1 Tax=Rhodopila sp. TaxID=2480087 RepID=UPI002BDC4480|nr:cytochrome c oxidase accessory protein CcoG [Rhodopila sp.]HVZ10062.1 cytochrome c oxidase accessory protein CcoG [Rhodopila sp.]